MGRSKAKSSAPAAAVSPAVAAAAKAELEKMGEKKLAEQILNQVYWMYTKPSKLTESIGRDGFGEEGLEKIASSVDMSVIHPRKKISVMIIGNHSAGKSSFMNWYVGEEIQDTGVAVETQGFTIITHGNSKQDFKGDIVLHMNSHLERVVDKLDAVNRKGFLDTLNAVVTTSTARSMRSVDLIDTPGLVDGNVNYPFDVNRIIAEMAEIVDLVLVFLDPIGQALCSRTMNVVADLNKRGYSDKMRYYLTKADTVRRRDDLNKVIVQITQNLASRVPSTHGFRLPTLWIPLPDGSNASTAAASSETNALQELCQEIHKTIQRKVQSNMSQLQEQSREAVTRIHALLELQKAKRATVRSLKTYSYALVLPLMLSVFMLAAIDTIEVIEVDVLKVVTPYVPTIRLLGYYDNLLHRMWVWVGAFLVLFVVFKVLAWRIRRVGAMSNDRIKHYQQTIQEVQLMQGYGQELNQLYVRAAQNPEYDE